MSELLIDRLWGVPFCKKCGKALVREQTGNPLSSKELGYQCPSCKAVWTAEQVKAAKMEPLP